MASEIRVDKINSLSGVGTVTLSPTGVDIAGITTAATLRATTGIVTSLTAGSLTSLGAISGTTGTFSGDVDIADKIIHTGDTDTAIRFPAADTVTVETAGSEALRIDSAGRMMVGTTSPQAVLTLDNTGQTTQTLLLCEDTGGSGAHAHIILKNTTGQVASILTTSDNLEFRVDDETVFADGSGNEHARITSSGAVGVGTATARAQFDVIKSTGNVMALFEGSNASQNHRVRIDASGGSSTTGLSISNSNSNNQTSLYHSGGNNNMLIMGGQTAGAEPTAGTAVATFASGGDVTVNTGNLVIGTNGKGIDFSVTSDASGATSELLDDYEEGTWTPTSNVGAITVSTAHYVKIGSLVYFQAYITFPSMSGSAEVQITNFPFDVAGGADYLSCSVNSDANIGGAQLVGQFNSGGFLVFALPTNSKATINQLSSKFVLFACTIMTH